MSEFSLILVLLLKTNKTLNDMAKIQIKSEKLTPFGGIFSIMEQFDALLAQTIDSTLGLRCTLFGYQYSEILRSLVCVYLCGGSCIEDRKDLQATGGIGSIYFPCPHGLRLMLGRNYRYGRGSLQAFLYSY